MNGSQSLITGDQLVRILVIVLPVLIGVLADGRVTRSLLREVVRRQNITDALVETHLSDHKAHRRGWRRR